MSAFLGDLHVHLVSEDKAGHSVWELDEDFGFHSDAMGMDIWARKGEQTDFASIPRAPIIFVMEGDKGHKAAVIHDHLYRESPHTMNRLNADNILKEALLVEGFTEDEAQAWWVGVRFGGGGHWDAGISAVAVYPVAPQSSSGIIP